MIGNRLKRARDAAGLSLRELEAAIGGSVSAQSIGKYERDEMMPSSGVLQSLSNALNVSLEYLLSSRQIELQGVDFRKAPVVSAREEKAVEAAVLDRVERYMELEELIPDESLWSVPIHSYFKIACLDDAERAADELRRIWELGIDPIPMMAELLEEKGIKVISHDLPMGVSGSKAFIRLADAADTPVVVVNKNHNGERQRFTLAHELAHLVLDCGDLMAQEQERAADRFAGAFLMARKLLLQLLGENRTSISLGELVELKAIFKVSVACLAVRCSQIGVLSKAAYSRLWGQIKSLGWNSQNSSEPNQLEPEIPRRMERMCLRAVAEDAISLSKAAELLGVNIFALDKRLSANAM